MRLRPVIFQATRTLTEDTNVAGYRLSAGVVVSPALGLVGLSEALHDDVGEFRPDRFLAGNPAPNTWIPCGGGPRGASERLSLSWSRSRSSARLLRAYEIEPVRPRPERLGPRGIINAPSHGSRIRVSARAS